jgi:hypothetical protein
MPRVRVEREGKGARVTLEEPREPLAWAVDAGVRAGKPFQVAWHAERAPGTKPTPAKRVAELGRVAGPLGVRVWYDDGRVATRVLEAP